MKNSKIIFLILSLFYCAGGYAYHWDMDDDYYDSSTWWDEDMDDSKWMDDIVVTPDDDDDDDYDPYYDTSYEYYLDSLDDDEDWDDYDDYDYSESGSNNEHSKGKEDPKSTEKKIQEILDLLVKELNYKLDISIPVTICLKEGTFKGTFNAQYYEGRIEVSPAIERYNQDDWPAIIYHEYIHSVNDKGVGRNESGEIITVKTGEKKVFTDEELQNEINKCIEDIPYMLSSDSYLRDCIGVALDEEYIYKPSNFYENEIDANKAVLDAADNGDLYISDEYRKETELAIQQNTYDYERALEYEKEHGLNPDGTKK